MDENIKQLIEENYVVICDSNVFLNIYRYSPGFSDFALRCMKTIQSSIILPSTVKIEFLKHFKSNFGAMEKRVRKISQSTEQKVTNSTRKILNIFDELHVLQYPDISGFRSSLSSKLDEVIELSKSYFEDRSILDCIANPWKGKDFVFDLVEQTINDSHIMTSVSQEDIYQICEEGEKRYKKSPRIPPGFNDEDKDGVRKYSDLIMWREILKYAKANSLNVIFVTDDIKDDWWLTNSEGLKVFHPDLIVEFENETHQKIAAYSSIDFYASVSSSYDIPQSDAIAIALRMTDLDYFDRVNNRVFFDIQDSLSFSVEELIEDSSHIGTFGIHELEISDFEFVSAEQVGRAQESISYIFTFFVEAEATSFDNWGRDDETKDIILGPFSSLTFEGEIYVEVIREAGLYLDFRADDGFEQAKIVGGRLHETSYQLLYDYGDEKVEDAFDLCPECGDQINLLNDGGNGF